MRAVFARSLMSRRLMMLVVIGLIAARCSDGSLSSITSPTPSASQAPPPAPPIPGPGTVTLIGRVTETAPTPLTGIGGALVEMTSGPSAGRSATTDSMGFYSIADVVAGGTINASAEWYIDTTLGDGAGRAATNFHLRPVPRTMTTTLIDTLGAQVGTCSDGVSMRPCHILMLPIHNSGPLEATLTWHPSDEANLDLTLFQTGSPSFISRSASAVDEPERISANLPGGATYELRVTYASGTAATKYTLHVTYLN